jgi:hypothetical protein
MEGTAENGSDEENLSESCVFTAGEFGDAVAGLQCI